MTPEVFYWILIPVVFLGGLVTMAGIYEAFIKDTPFTQAEKRRAANERFASLVGGEK